MMGVADVTRSVVTMSIAVACLGGVIAAASTQSALSLSALTVPAASLPGGCALTPPPAPALAQVSGGGANSIQLSPRFGFPTNPWSGTDRKIVAMVHRAIDGPEPVRPLPDLPPTASGGAAASERKWAENILEAYRAEYVSGDTGRVEVFAVTFSDAKLTVAPDSLSAVLNPPRETGHRIVRGATVVRVSVHTSAACFGAVRAHIESLK